jgi:N utilization substance protein B
MFCIFGGFNPKKLEMVQRREAREFIMQALFAYDVSKNEPGQLLHSIIKPHFTSDETNYSFAKSLFFKTLDHQPELDEIIQKHIKNWRISRLAMVDKIVLRSALCEFRYFPEIPAKVTINEAIEIAKKYSTAKSGKFVNGILDAALARLKKENKIEKRGRGLKETSSK